MNINSKKFKRKYKDLFELGYCAECIAIITSNATVGNLCEKCERTLFKHQFINWLFNTRGK